MAYITDTNTVHMAYQANTILTLSEGQSTIDQAVDTIEVLLGYPVMNGAIYIAAGVRRGRGQYDS